MLLSHEMNPDPFADSAFPFEGNWEDFITAAGAEINHLS